jgi:AraC family transcriptional regulator, transcriptional activator of pobA
MASKHTIERPIPVYELYGEEQQWLTPDLLHCEAIATRSRLHNWEILPHSHHGLLQLLWLEQGEATLQLDDWKGQMEAGCVLIVPQHCIHGFQFSNYAQGIVITVAYPLLDSLGTDLSTALQSESAARVFLLEENEEQALIEAMLHKLMKEYQQQQGYRRELIESSLTVVLACLMQQAQSMQPRIGEHPKRARRYLSEFTNLIEQDYMHHHQLTFYATKIGISTAHLNAVCREFIQRSALDLIHARIMLEAKRNFVYTSLTIKTVAEMLGFADPAYFTRFFKRQAGLSPKEFRQQLVVLTESEKNKVVV